MRTKLLAILLLLGMAAAVQAQDSTDVRKITLNEAIDIALDNNFSLKQARNNVDAAEAGVLSAKADFAPSVSARMSGSRSVGTQFNQIQLRYVKETRNSINGSIGADVTLFQGFRNIMNLRQSEANASYEKSNLQRTRETIVFNTASQFLQILVDEELLQISRQNLDASKQQMEQIKAQVEVGSRPVVDQYNQESTVASNELEVIQRENTLQYDKTKLIRTLQLDPLDDYSFEAPDVKTKAIKPEKLDLRALTNQALQNRNDLQAQRLLINSRKYSLQTARANYYPSISANIGISSNYFDQYRAIEVVNGPNGQPMTQQTSLGFRDQFFDQLVTRSAGISVNVPIFSNLNTRTNVQQARINFKNAKLALEDKKYAVQEEVRQAYNDYTSLAKQLETTKKALTAAEKTYETQKERYSVGASTFIELSQANADYVQAKANRVRAVYNFLFQEKLLDYYLGKLNQNLSFQDLQK